MKIFSTLIIYFNKFGLRTGKILYIAVIKFLHIISQQKTTQHNLIQMLSIPPFERNLTYSPNVLGQPIFCFFYSISNSKGLFVDIKLCKNLNLCTGSCNLYSTLYSLMYCWLHRVECIIKFAKPRLWLTVTGLLNCSSPFGIKVFWKLFCKGHSELSRRT